MRSCRIVSSFLSAIALSVLIVPTAATAQTQLPGIVVEGATIEVRSPRPAPSSVPAAPAGPAPTQPAQQPATPPSIASAPVAEPTGEPAAGSAPSDAAGTPLYKVGTAVTVVTGAELRAQQVRHAADALRSLPGVSVGRTGSFAGLTDVRIRGSEANHVLVLIDGIEANPATTGGFDFSHLSTDEIERIEVIRGPQTGLYGAHALAGVINIVTRGGRGPLSLTARAEQGSFNTEDRRATVSGGNAQAWGSLSYGERRTKGFNIAPYGGEKDGAGLQTFSARAGAKAGEDITVEFTLRNIRKRGERDGDGGPDNALSTALDTLSRFGSTVWLAGGELTWAQLGGLLTHKLKATTATTKLEDWDVSSFGTFYSRNDSQTDKYAYAATLRLDAPALLQSRHFLTFQAERARESFVVPTDTGVTHERVRESLVGEWRAELLDSLFLTATGRHDASDAFGAFDTWRTAASLRLPGIVPGSWLRLHASAGTGVKYPGLFEQFGSIPSLFRPNPALTPETSFGWDAGIELSSRDGRHVLDVTWFEQTLENRIATVTVPGQFVLTAVNRAGMSPRSGLETSARTELAPGLVLSASYTLLDAFEPSGAREIRRPQHSGRADLDWRFHGGRGNLHIAAIYNGVAYDTAFRLTPHPLFGFQQFIPERAALADYWLVTVATSYEIQKGVELFGRVENALDWRYHEIYGYETAGVAAYGGVRIKLDLIDGKPARLRD
jgi:vitamin B12 transporter